MLDVARPQSNDWAVLRMDTFPLWLLFVISMAFVMGSIEIGRVASLIAHRRSHVESETVANFFVGPILGLVAFMLAFTFGIVSSRYDERKSLVREEANAIGTTYMRADFMAEPGRSRTRDLLAEYLESRIVAVRNRDLVQIEALRTDAVRLQNELWNLAVSNDLNNTNSAIASLYVDSLNKVMDIHSLRVSIGLQARVPIGIWVILYFLVGLGMFGVGFQMTVSGSRGRTWLAPILALSFSLVLFLIACLDRPNNSFITVSQQPLVDLRSSITEQ